jgi:3-deoxy-D-manno-octulosonate 8-phosphate phosphatase (KDO 8-P phosphatase)
MTEVAPTLFRGRFRHSEEQFLKRLSAVKVLVFDWDGVFNKGEKSSGGHSGFTEPDSMGVNLLRFAFWMRDNGRLPISAIVSGAPNEMAANYAQREHFHAIMTGIKQKDVALELLSEKFGFNPEEVAFFFDDIIDLEAAAAAGLKLFFPNPSAPATQKYILDRELFDYMPVAKAGEGALREVCELMISAMGLFEEVVNCRRKFDGRYLKYLKERDDIFPDLAAPDGNRIR